MSKNRKRRKAETPSPAQTVAELIAKLPLSVYMTKEAEKQNKRRKIGVAKEDVWNAGKKAHSQNNRFRGHLGEGILYYDKIHSSGRGAGALDTRYVVATKKLGKYFILGFYKKSEIEHPSPEMKRNLLKQARKLLAAADTAVAAMLEDGRLIPISPPEETE